MEKDLVSIIVPVFNTEKYIERCLNTLIGQSYSNIEIVLINDGSTDRSLEIAQKYVKMDNRIKLFTQNNAGQSVARNVGLRKATGQYIAFVDSDDFVALDFINKMLKLAQENQADIVQCGFLRGKSETWVENKQADKIGVSTCTGVEFLRKYFDKDVEGLGGILCIKLFKRELFTEIKMPEGRVHEDVAVIYKLLYIAKRVAYTNEKLYYYFMSSNSTMRSKFSIKRLDWLTAFEEKAEFLLQNNEIVLYNRSLQEYEAVLLKTYYNMQRYNIGTIEQKKEILLKIRKTNEAIYHTCEISHMAKIIFKIGTQLPYLVGLTINWIL